MSEKKEEKEIILDLSKKIKFGKGVYISLGVLILSVGILVVQILMICFNIPWASLLLNFLYLLRGTKKDEEIIENLDEAEENEEEESGTDNE